MDMSILIGAAATCFAGGLFPWISSEVAVVGASFLLPAEWLPTLVLACASGPMIAKVILYSLVRWAPSRLPGRAQKLLAKAESIGERRSLVGVTLLSSSSVSIPPFYLVTLAAGTLRLPLPIFVPIGFLGTFARYGVLAWVAVRAGAG